MAEDESFDWDDDEAKSSPEIKPHSPKGMSVESHGRVEVSNSEDDWRRWAEKKMGEARRAIETTPGRGSAAGDWEPDEMAPIASVEKSFGQSKSGKAGKSAGKKLWGGLKSIGVNIKGFFAAIAAGVIVLIDSLEDIWLWLIGQKKDSGKK